VTRIQRPAAVAATVVLAFYVSACGGPPADASTDEFCATAIDRSWAEDLSADADGEQVVDALQAWGDDLEKVGTPEDIPDDARKGYEITVDYLGDLDPDDFDDLGDVAEVNDDLSEEDQVRVTAFNAYVAETCPQESPADVPEPPTS
jgi:hypothetical protein